MKRFVILAVALSLAGCVTPPDVTKSAVEAMGLHDVVVGNADFGCGEDDLVGRKFTAKNTDGVYVEGVVCKGLLFKGATVRITGFAR